MWRKKGAGMFRKRNVLAKPQWMGIAALIMIFIMVLNPVLALAQEPVSDEEIVIFTSDGDEIVIGENDQGGENDDLGGFIQGKAAAIIDEEIWAQIDKDELRSLVDVESLKESINEAALLDSIDRDELRAGIDGAELIAQWSVQELEDEFVERKIAGESFLIDEDGNAIVIDGVESGNVETALGDTAAETQGETAAAETETRREIVASEEQAAEAETEAVAHGVTEDETEPEVTLDSDSEVIFDPDSEEVVVFDNSLAQIISEETRILEDGREVKNFKVRLPMEPVDEHPMDVINMQLPIIGEHSPFDFVVDPMHFIYQASASFEGGKNVEENAGVLFRNTAGEYDFSHKSDMLKVVNKSNVPVKLIITASIVNHDSVPFVASESELQGKEPNLFMALTDDLGIASIITNDEDAVIETVLEPVPDGAYSFAWNEEAGKYDYVLNEAPEEVIVEELPEDVNVEETDETDETPEEKEDPRFDSYSFGIVADCNTEADWSSVVSRPVVNVSWVVEPVLTDWDAINSDPEARRAEILSNKEEYEVFLMVKTAELVEERLIELIQQKLDELKELELEAMIEDEVNRLAIERYAQICEEMGIEAPIEVIESDLPSELNDTKSDNAEPSQEETVIQETAAEPENEEIVIVDSAGD